MYFYELIDFFNQLISFCVLIVAGRESKLYFSVQPCAVKTLMKRVTEKLLSHSTEMYFVLWIVIFIALHSIGSYSRLGIIHDLTISAVAT